MQILILVLDGLALAVGGIIAWRVVKARERRLD
jgi:hypothetical protein